MSTRNPASNSSELKKRISDLPNHLQEHIYNITMGSKAYDAFTKLKKILSDTRPSDVIMTEYIRNKVRAITPLDGNVDYIVKIPDLFEAPYSFEIVHTFVQTVDSDTFDNYVSKCTLYKDYSDRRITLMELKNPLLSTHYYSSLEGMSSSSTSKIQVNFYNKRNHMHRKASNGELVKLVSGNDDIEMTKMQMVGCFIAVQIISGHTYSKMIWDSIYSDGTRWNTFKGILPKTVVKHIKETMEQLKYQPDAGTNLVTDDIKINQKKIKVIFDEAKDFIKITDFQPLNPDTAAYAWIYVNKKKNTPCTIELREGMTNNNYKRNFLLYTFMIYLLTLNREV
jgi:hypothetical protein